MNIHLSCFFSVLPLVLLTAVSAFPSPLDEYLEETPDFEDLLSDLPPGFAFTNTSETELRRIPFLNPHDIQSILSLRDSLSIGIDSFDTRERVSPLARFLMDNPEGKSFQKVNGKRIAVRGGFLFHPGETPDNGRQYLKITAGSEEGIALSFLGEHDPFEPRMLDLSSFGIRIPIKRFNSEAVLGDFRPGFGMGLLFSRYSVYLRNTHPRYYSTSPPLNSSFEESRFMRGGMLTTRLGRCTSSFWISDRKIDGVVEDGKTETIVDSGMHTEGTPHENLEEQITGAHVSLGGIRSELSISGALSRYSPGFTRLEGERYFGRPEGRVFRQLSISGRTGRGPAELTFEHARMNGGEYATLGGITLERENVRSSLLIRDYSDRYWAPRSGAPSAFGSNSNERGIYSSVEMDFPSRIFLSAALDLARTRGRSWIHSMPISRSQLFLSLRKRVRPHLEGSLFFRTADDTESGDGRWSFRGRIESPPGNGRRWGWRGTAVWSAGAGEGGPVAETALFFRNNIACSLAGFRIPSYSSRYYLYQPDVPGRGSNSGLWGKGYSLAMTCTVGRFSGRFRLTDSDLMKLQREVTLQTDLYF